MLRQFSLRSKDLKKEADIVLLLLLGLLLIGWSKRGFGGKNSRGRVEGKEEEEEKGEDGVVVSVTVVAFSIFLVEVEPIKVCVVVVIEVSGGA